MARIVYSDGNSASALVFQPMIEEISDYIGRANRHVADRVTEIGRGFIDRARQFRERSGYRRLVDTREDLRDIVNGIGERAKYLYLRTAADIVAAPQPMRVWLYNHPVVAKAVEEGTLKGWDEAPVLYDEHHRQEMMDYIKHGSIEDDSDTVSYTYSDLQTMFQEQYELTPAAKNRISLSWDTIVNCISEESIDPTDPYLPKI